MTITEFLEARIAEDEAAAKRGGWHNGGATFANDNYGCLLVQPARVLAECVAKRAILGDYVELWKRWAGSPGRIGFPGCNHYEAEPDATVLRRMAAVYSDHPDYDKDWAL